METYSGVDIARWWVDNHSRAYGSAQDCDGFKFQREGNDYEYVWMSAYYDADFQATYLLEVRRSEGEGNPEVRDYLFIGHGVGDKLEVEWFNHPLPTSSPFEEHLKYLREGLDWWAAHTADFLEKPFD